MFRLTNRKGCLCVDWNISPDMAKSNLESDERVQRVYSAQILQPNSQLSQNEKSQILTNLRD